MRLETVPLIIGAIIALVGLGLILDAWIPDRSPSRERRRRVRRERSRAGEFWIGLGVVAMGASVAGRDTWRYAILATLVGAVLLLLGAFMNRGFLRDLMFNRGASRRRSGGLRDVPAPGAPDSAVDPGREPRLR